MPTPTCRQAAAATARGPTSGSLAYYNDPFWVIRWVVVFAVWTAFATLFRRWSLRQRPSSAAWPWSFCWRLAEALAYEVK